jgi:mono/diheme cytochrome c family protein
MKTNTRTLRYAICSLAVVLSAAAGAADDTGARLYFNHCAACHGSEGEGGGPVAAAMSVAVPNLRTLSQRNDGVFPADAAHGDRLMPVWGDVFRGPEQGTAKRTVRRRIDALVAYLAMLQYP